MLEKFTERKYPGALESIYELIGNTAPTPKDIADWKATWANNGNKVTVINYSKSSKLCAEIGIHYNLFQYMHEGRIGIDVSRSMVFYYEEDEIMFKMVKPHDV